MISLTACKATIAFLVGLSLAGVCNGPAFAVAWRGTVVDARTGKPVPGITVNAGVKGRSGDAKAKSVDDGVFVLKYSDRTAAIIAKNAEDY